MRNGTKEKPATSGRGNPPPSTKKKKKSGAAFRFCLGWVCLFISAVSRSSTAFFYQGSGAVHPSRATSSRLPRGGPKGLSVERTLPRGMAHWDKACRSEISTKSTVQQYNSNRRVQRVPANQGLGAKNTLLFPPPVFRTAIRFQVNPTQPCCVRDWWPPRPLHAVHSTWSRGCAPLSRCSG